MQTNVDYTAGTKEDNKKREKKRTSDTATQQLQEDVKTINTYLEKVSIKWTNPHSMNESYAEVFLPLRENKSGGVTSCWVNYATSRKNSIY